MNTQESSFAKKNEGEEGEEEVTSADIRNELFEGDNIITGKTDNGQSELLSGPFASTFSKSGAK
jgi:hypothetical protein